MTFIVRTVSRTADGRVIIRPTLVDKETIGIGRDATNDIHLADLAVEPFHAAFTRLPGGRVLAQTVGGLGFAVDGRSTKRAEIDANRGAELRFGGHLLTLAMEDGVATISVERTDALSDATGEKDERTVFSLAGLLPGKRLGAWTFLILILAACLAWPVYSWATWHDVKTRPVGFHADKMWSSGPLSQAHRALENNCQSCHEKAFVSVEDNKCVACHIGIHDHADPKRQINAMAPPNFGKRVQNGFKSVFGVPTGQRCVDCHTEHQGAGPMPATAQAFCTDCHATLKSRVTDTKLADVSDFGTAHPQFRPAIVTDSSGAAPIFRRVSLDASPIQSNGLKFPHGTHLSATNGVARMAQTMKSEQGWDNALACKDCHKPTSDGVRFQPVEMERDCQMCHSLAFDRIGGTVRTLRHGQPAQVVADLRAYFRSTGPVRPISLGGVERRRPGNYAASQTSGNYASGLRNYGGGADAAISAVFTKGGACYDCHVVDRTGDANSAGWRVRPVVQPTRFLQKGWFNHEAHKTDKCETCHKAATSETNSPIMLPGITTCRECHGGESSRADVPSSCAMCHSYHIDASAPWRAKRDVSRAKGQGRFVVPAGYLKGAVR
ncbi:cytochrome C [Sphingomonas paeninsulae]|uniref:Cytochrome C n=1 Tax=Sphingomonas paeninsulae TaxID=2319844 RepID=A0A494TD74_SPHPE|nr:cytochrome c3 family protein [Sphingomonas paeninsulae]AYJ87459.1 cytochrome C [Sphingomonas paeninsulae]